MKRIGNIVIMKSNEVPTIADLATFAKAFLQADWAKGVANAKAMVAELTNKVATFTSEVKNCRESATNKQMAAKKAADEKLAAARKAADMEFAADNRAADELQAKADKLSKELSDLCALIGKFEIAC